MPGPRDRLRRFGQALGFLVLIVLLYWLWSSSERVSVQSHNAYMQLLQRVQRSDVELNAAVLASYSGILQNYDPLVRHINDIRSEEEDLRNIPPCLPDDARERLRRLVEQLLASHWERVDDVDRFMRVSSVLRNSSMYFPQAAELALQQMGRHTAELEQLVLRIQAFSNGMGAGDEERLTLKLEELQKENHPFHRLPAFRQLLAHGEQIVKRRPEIDMLVDRILHPASIVLLEDVARTYVEGYEEASRRAASFRQMFYLLTLLLAAYVLYALFRFERDRRRLAVAHKNLAERYAAQLSAERELRLYATVFTNAAEGMAITDAETRIVAINPAFSTITGYAAGDVIGRPTSLLKSGRQDEDFYRAMWRELEVNGRWQGEIWNRHKNGDIFPEWLSIASVKDEQGELTHYIGICTDISERKRNEARIHHLAHHDALTGLPNRLLLEDRISQAMLKSKRSGKWIGLAFIDLDRFKNINDTLGHEVGDRLLVQAAQRGLSVLRDSDTLSRQGGDEFVVVLPDLENRQDAMHVIRKLLAALSQPYVLAGHELTITSSAGIALYPDDGKTVSELLRKADTAMYRAKEDGGNTCRFFSSEINTASLGTLLLENDLHGALDRDELHMHFQPKVDAADGRLVGAEALMRWEHPTRGQVSPGIFIPLAEATGLINAFGEWAIRTVCAQQRAWLDAGLPAVPVAVNISAQQFAQRDLPRLVGDMLTEYNLPPRLLELELTESLLVRNASRAAEVLETLRRMNVSVALDDFGTGYSSLSYLRQFPVQALKIDRSFISEIGEPGESGESVRLVSAIIAMAHELGLLVVAEGVENASQCDYLKFHQCDQFQGYLFGKPMPATEFRQLLGAGKASQDEAAVTA